MHLEANVLTNKPQMATPPALSSHLLLYQGPRGNRSKQVPPEWSISGSKVRPLSLFLSMSLSLYFSTPSIFFILLHLGESI